MRHTTRLLLLSLAVAGLAAGCAQKNITGSTAELTYTPEETVDFTIPSGAISSIEVEDNRPDEGRAGLREAESDKSQNSIVFQGDPAQWVKTGATQVLSSAGVNVSASDAPKLHLKLDELYLREDVFVASEYDSRVRLSAELRDGGKTLWKSSSNGFAENYGEAGSQENYAQTFNHALYKALKSLFNDSGFQRALTEGR